MSLLSMLAAALVIGVADMCPTNRDVRVEWDYAEAIRKAGHIPVVVARTAKAEDLDRVLAHVDVLLMAGGEDVDPTLYGETAHPGLGRVNAVRDTFDYALLRAAVRRELPIFGICRGSQVINTFFGGTLIQDIPSEYARAGEISHKRSRGKRGGLHPVSIVPGTRLADVVGTSAYEVNTSHHQAVLALAPGMRVTAWSPDGIVEGIEATWYPAAGVQFHPEWLAVGRNDPRAERLFQALHTVTGRAPRAARPRRPIGVFDSGIGGLSVLERILTLDAFDNATGAEKPDGKPDFADEEFVYFGDQANMPYGRYPAEGKTDFLRDLVIADARFVLGGEGHAPAKAVVIACNTATAYGLEAVEAMPRPNDAPVVGVVKAGSEAVLDALAGETQPYAIAVMATPGTISSGVYARTLGALLSARGVTTPVEIACRGGVGLAEAVENNAPDMHECARTNLLALVEDYRARGAKAPIRALVLGCTHYPYVLETFRKTFAELRTQPAYAPLLADDILFVDPAVYTAIACYRALRKDGLLRAVGRQQPKARVAAFLSVGANGPLDDATKYGRARGATDLGTKIVPMNAETLSASTRAGVRATYPACAAALGL